jgi:hypothetical protein
VSTARHGTPRDRPRPAPEGAGVTRWAAEAYEDGPTAAEAFARVRTEFPDPPPVPAESAQPCFHQGPYDVGRFTDEIDADQLDLQTAIAANDAFAVLDAIEHGLQVHPRPADLELDAARIASHTAGLRPDLADISGCSPAEMNDRALAWLWAGAAGVAVLAGQWKPEPAVSKEADKRLAAIFGQTSRRLNRWTVQGLAVQLRLAEDGRWHPYERKGSRWTPAGPRPPTPKPRQGP